MEKTPYPDSNFIRKQLFDKDTFSFHCHGGLSCFTRCCKNADMFLYPYDIIRLKKRLGISSDTFLKERTISAFRDNPYFPSLMLRMTDTADKACPFLSEKGCDVYEDRPFSCRAYPLERAVARNTDEFRGLTCYFIAEHSHCMGHGESKEWTVEEWIKDQDISLYNQMNDLWVEVDTIFRNNPWGPDGTEGKALKMAFMACFNVDKMRSFVFDSSFLSRFHIPSVRIENCENSDVEMMKLGFDWVKYFLAGRGPLASK